MATKQELEELSRDLKERNRELKEELRLASADRDSKGEQVEQLLAQNQELNTKALWLEHRLAQFKKAHAAMVDGFLS